MDGRDRWWGVTSSTDVRVMGDEIAAALSQHAWPFFDTTKDLARWMRNPRPAGVVVLGEVRLVLAVLAAEDGEQDEAPSFLRSAVEEHRGTPHEATLRAAATRLGVTLAPPGPID